jgi:hypothetical protein
MPPQNRLPEWAISISEHYSWPAAKQGKTKDFTKRRTSGLMSCGNNNCSLYTRSFLRLIKFLILISSNMSKTDISSRIKIQPLSLLFYLVLLLQSFEKWAERKKNRVAFVTHHGIQKFQRKNCGIKISRITSSAHSHRQKCLIILNNFILYNFINETEGKKRLALFFLLGRLYSKCFGIYLFTARSSCFFSPSVISSTPSHSLVFHMLDVALKTAEGVLREIFLDFF